MNDVTSISAPSSSPWAIEKRSWSVFWGAMIGWILDSFDLSMLFLLIPYLSILFFPEGEGAIAFIGALSIYLVALIFRPLGGLFFGRFGDRVGRRLSMVISLTGLGIAVFMSGLLPTYATAGVVAPALLVLMRILTGVFAGGEYGNSSVIFMESVPSRSRGRFGGLLQGGFPIGFTLVTLAFIGIYSLLGPQEFLNVGWRIMFFLGIIPAFVGVILRYKMPESFLWTKLYREGNIDNFPIRSLFFSRKYIFSFLLGVVMMTGIAWVYYLTLGFYPTTLQEYSGVGSPLFAFIIIIAILTSFVGYMVSGIVSDHIGRKRTIIIFVILALIATFPADYVIFQGSHQPIMIGIFASILAFSTTGIYGVIPSFLSEKFPTRIRGTGVGVSFNSGFIVGSWSSAFVLLISSPNNIWLFTSIAMVIGEILILIASLLSKETHKVDLDAIE